MSVTHSFECASARCLGDCIDNKSPRRFRHGCESNLYNPSDARYVNVLALALRLPCSIEGDVDMSIQALGYLGVGSDKLDDWLVIDRAPLEGQHYFGWKLAAAAF